MAGGSWTGQQTDGPFGGLEGDLGIVALGLGLAGLGPCVFQEGRREAFGALRCGLAMQLCRCDQ